MAINSEAKIPWGGSAVGLAMVYGNATEDAQGTTIILPGSTQHVRKITSWGVTPTQNITGGAFNVVKTYDATTYDADILTITCTAGDNFDYWYIGFDNGDL
jgi:hypothetical protein